MIYIYNYDILIKFVKMPEHLNISQILIEHSDMAKFLTCANRAKDAFGDNVNRTKILPGYRPYGASLLLHLNNPEGESDDSNNTTTVPPLTRIQQSMCKECPIQCFPVGQDNMDHTRTTIYAYNSRAEAEAKAKKLAEYNPEDIIQKLYTEP